MSERILVIIPAYNEENSILPVVREVVSAGYDYIVINDGSTDETLRVCREHGVNVLNLPVNLGIGGAVQAGHRYALQNGYDFDVQFDGDGQHDASYIKKILEPVLSGRADLCVGSRFIEKTGFQSTILRRLGIRWLAFLIRLICGVSILDCTSGFRACNRDVIRHFSRDYSMDFPEPESVASVAKNGFKVLEVPVVMHERKSGKSSIGAFSSVYYMLKVSLAILLVGLRHSR